MRGGGRRKMRQGNERCVYTGMRKGSKTRYNFVTINHGNLLHDIDNDIIQIYLVLGKSEL